MTPDGRDNVNILKFTTESLSLTQYPDHFMHAPTNSKKVIPKYKEMQPKKELGLEEAPKVGRLHFIPSSSIYNSDPSHPSFLALRFNEILENLLMK